MLTATLLFVASAALAAAPFSVTSPIVEAGFTPTQLFNGFGCTGENQSPAISWTGAPEGTKSFALLVHDPDAPTGGAGWWHWSVFDIPASAEGLPAGATADSGIPAGAVQGPTDFGVPGWGGPCPPEGKGKHRYIFSLHALGVETLTVPDGATASLIGYLVNHNTLATARFETAFER
jgi:Raf kinase inhibitor-like YbhB/YbcL family protein